MLINLTAGPKIILLVCICRADKHPKLVTVTTAGTVSPLAPNISACPLAVGFTISSSVIVRAL